MGAPSDSHRFKLSVQVNPGTSRRRGVWREDHLKVNLTEPAEDGRANEELINYIADLFGLKASDVTLASGHSSRRKELELTNLSRRELTETIKSLST